MNFPAGSGGDSKFKWGKDGDYGDLDNTTGGNGVSIGEGNVWEWAKLAKRSLHWLAKIKEEVTA